jgi:hypothetical protein
MKRRKMAIATMVLAGAAATGGAADKPKQVHGTGCVEPGVEARCVVLKDVKTGTLYNLLFKGPKPQIGDGVEFNGVLFEGMTMCMQGTPVEVSDWARSDSLKCSKSEAPKQ